jgi:hypothetical protein
MTAGVIMLLTLPFFTSLIPEPFFFSILAVLMLILLSGLMSPRYKGLVAISMIVSAGAFLIFEYYAISVSKTLGIESPFFLINQLLALIFFFATYFGTKSTRWLTQRDK